MVGMRALEVFLKRHRRFGLDSSVFIYFLEENPRHHAACRHVFETVEAGDREACTSTISLLEVLVQPYRRGREDLVSMFFGLLATYRHLQWVDMTIEVADKAAQIRAQYGLKTPDSIQAASALVSGAGGFLCNDAAFRRIKEMDCLVLDDLIAK